MQSNTRWLSRTGVGALAVAQSNPSIVWAGTGEAWAIRDANKAHPSLTLRN